MDTIWSCGGMLWNSCEPSLRTCYSQRYGQVRVAEVPCARGLDFETWKYAPQPAEVCGRVALKRENALYSPVPTRLRALSTLVKIRLQRITIRCCTISVGQHAEEPVVCFEFRRGEVPHPPPKFAIFHRKLAEN